METLAGHTPKGFLKTIAGSFILHVMAVLIGLLLFKTGPKKVFFSPVYSVNLVDPASLKGAASKAGSKGTAQKAKGGGAAKGGGTVKATAKAKTVKTSQLTKATAKAKTKGKTKTIKTSQLKPKATKAKAAAPPAVSIEAALKGVAENVRKTQESALVAASIEGLRQKTEADSMEVSRAVEEIRKGLGETKPPTGRGTGGKASGPEGGTGQGIGGAGTGGPGVAWGAGGAGGAGALNGLHSVTTASGIDVEFARYLGALRDRVQEKWGYPEIYQRAGLSIIVSLRIARTGHLINVWVEESSGNTRFDSSLVKAVKKAAPFEPLPPGFDGAWLETGLRFCPECNY